MSVMHSMAPSVQASVASTIRKRCRKCNHEKDAAEFPFATNGKRRNRCRTCLVAVNKEQRENRKKNGKALEYSRRPERRAKTQASVFEIKTGIPFPDYEAMNAAQGGVCAICGKPESATSKYGVVRKLAVDHCHRSGKIRGLLCFNCNAGIARFLDDPHILRLAAEYIEKSATDS